MLDSYKLKDRRRAAAPQAVELHTHVQALFAGSDNGGRYVSLFPTEFALLLVGECFICAYKVL